ncbi:MAG: DJ-1/PfpI/YhbO family deglycase/protease, partial [Bacteroidota bacterium]
MKRFFDTSFVAILASLLLVFAVQTMCGGEAFSQDRSTAVRVIVLTGEGFHDGETLMPIGYLTNRGAEVTVVGPERGTVKAYNSDITVEIERAIGEVSIDEFDVLILPGGQAPATIREDQAVVSFTRDFVDSGKVVAAICHGPQVLARAGVLDGRTVTAVGSIQSELTDAGATFEDTQVMQDGNIIT